jgi:hypothetical protein
MVHPIVAAALQESAYMRTTLFIVVLTALGCSTLATLADGAGETALRCTAFAASTGGPGTAPVATSIDIVVDRWSSDAERRRLLEALTRGQDAMLETLRDLPRIGYIRTPGSLGWDLHFAQAAPGEEGGRRVVVATDRPIGFWEAANRPRTIEYPFTFIQMQLEEDGEGEGKLSLATRVISTSDGRFVQLENYAAQPVQLNQVSCR